MNQLVYILVGLIGLSLVRKGYKELRERRFETPFRPYFLRKAKRVSVTGNRVIPLALWHLVAGVILCIAGLQMFLQNRPNALGFIMICVSVFTFMEVAVEIISIGSLREKMMEKYHQPTPKNED